jgi:ferritin-like metal-binding protein YciE
MREKPTGELLEFFNVGAAQKVERYEITSYESLIDMADKLGLTDAVGLLEENLQEEEAALNKLKAIASEFDVTDEAEQVEEAEEDAEDQHATSRR